MVLLSPPPVYCHLNTISTSKITTINCRMNCRESLVNRKGNAWAAVGLPARFSANVLLLLYQGRDVARTGDCCPTFREHHNFPPRQQTESQRKHINRNGDRCRRSCPIFTRQALARSHTATGRTTPLSTSISTHRKSRELL